MRTLTIGIIAALLLTGCGQRGPLSLPQKHSTTMTNQPQKSSTPAPNVATPGKVLQQHNLTISS